MSAPVICQKYPSFDPPPEIPRFLHKLRTHPIRRTNEVLPKSAFIETIKLSAPVICQIYETKFKIKTKVIIEN